MRHADHEGDGAGPVVRPAPASEAAGRSSVGGAAGLRLVLIEHDLQDCRQGT